MCVPPSRRTHINPIAGFPRHLYLNLVPKETCPSFSMKLFRLNLVYRLSSSLRAIHWPPLNTERVWKKSLQLAIGTGGGPTQKHSRGSLPRTISHDPLTPPLRYPRCIPRQFSYISLHSKRSLTKMSIQEAPMLVYHSFSCRLLGSGSFMP